MADKGMILQHQIRENSQELGDFLGDLNNWEKDIKKKDEDLKKTAAINQLTTAPIRKKTTQKGSKEKKIANSNLKEDKEILQPKTRISSYDYDSWSKFDVDAACGEADKEEEEQAEDDEDESEEEDLEAALEIEQQRRLQRSVFEKDKGNDLFKEGKYEAAVNRYTIASELDPNSAIIFANRAMALLKLERHAAAEVDCTRSLEIDPEYTKAIARRATARTKLKKLQGAKDDQEHLLLLQPNNKQAKMDLEILKKELVKREKDVPAMKKRKQRSKKPLRRILIEDVGSDDENTVSSENGKDSENVQRKIAGVKNVVELHNQRIPDYQKPTEILTRESSTGKDNTTLKINFKVPLSSVQFETDFPKIKKDPDEFYKYFSAIPTNMYKSLLHHSVDDVLPKAVECFDNYYKRDNKDYFNELRNLAEVPRFDMARMFLSKTTKKVVDGLFQDLINKNTDQSEEIKQIMDLAKKYGSLL